jgi:hypothetical protein
VTGIPGIVFTGAAKEQNWDALNALLVLLKPFAVKSNAEAIRGYVECSL